MITGIKVVEHFTYQSDHNNVSPVNTGQDVTKIKMFIRVLTNVKILTKGLTCKKKQTLILYKIRRNTKRSATGFIFLHSSPRILLQNIDCSQSSGTEKINLLAVCNYSSVYANCSGDVCNGCSHGPVWLLLVRWSTAIELLQAVQWHRSWNPSGNRCTF